MVVRTLHFQGLLALIGAAVACDSGPAVDLPPSSGADASAARDGGSAMDAGIAVAPDAATPVVDGGTRLVLRSVVAVEGGARRALDVLDTQTGQGCYIPAGTAGSTVACTPSAHGMVVYLEPTCATARVETAYGDHAYVFATGAGDFYGTVRLGARVADGDRPRYMSGPGGNCFMSAARSELAVHEIAEILPDERRAQGSIEELALGDRIVGMSFSGFDRSHFLLATTDRLSGASCAPGVTSAGPRCVPDTNMATDEGWLDPRCERLAVMEYGGVAVAEIAGVFHRFERISVPGLDALLGRRAPGGQCTTSTENLGRRTLYYGTPYPAAEWPSLVMAPRGGGPVIARPATLPSGDPVEPLHRLDRDALFEDRGVPCGPLWIGGVLRCAPAAPPGVRGWSVLFADARCSQRAMVLEPGASPPSVLAIEEGRAGPDGASLPTGRVLAVAEELPAGRAYQHANGGGTCVPAASTGRFFALGREVPGHELPELRITLDP